MSRGRIDPLRSLLVFAAILLVIVAVALGGIFLGGWGT